ncbi:hypothetical protein [Fundidesulfovibrio putealis]|uniref:hypothetical protein n=1 Tax=Fundidesulfovibrio putealis TaxID=270496 RepID=UPI0003F6ECF6|nr:hypothetical protein [Fundidesulfovibrio putealis]
MTFQKRMLKGFAMAAVLAGGLAVSGSFQEAKAQMMYGYDQNWVQPVPQSVVQNQQAYPPQQNTYGYVTPKNYKRYVNTSGGYYGQGRHYGPRGYGYGYGCSW